MEKNRIHSVRMGDKVRKSYSRINEVLEMPNLIEVQKNSTSGFWMKDLKKPLRTFLR